MFNYNDGGRSKAGYKGIVGDCAARALSIAKDINYKTAYDIIAKENANFGYAKSARNGVHKIVFDKVLKDFGMKWYPAPKFNKRKAKCLDMPTGMVIARQARHFVAVFNGIPQDIWNSSDKMVYGYWK